MGFISAFIKVLHKIELGVVHRFNDWCQSPHWSFFWILYFIGWTLWRQLAPHPWYTNDIDLLVITWSSAALPFFVENALKYTSGRQLQEQQKQMELLEKIAILNQEMAKRILAVVEDVHTDIQELQEGIDDADAK